MRRLGRALLVATALWSGAGFGQSVAPAALPDAPSQAVLASLGAMPAEPEPGFDLPALRARQESSSRLEPQVLPPLPPELRPHVVSSRTCAIGEASARECGVHWAPLLRHSFEFLLLQHAGNLALDGNMRHNVSHGHWFHNWMDSAGATRITRWNDGDSFLVNYIGHPMMGAVTDYLYIQNDPRGRDLGIRSSRAYWMSRLRAMAFTAVYAAQWEVGPVSEASIGNTGSGQYISRASGRWTNGTGAVDFVMTPVGGTVWVIGEDLIDRHLIWWLEGKTNNKAALLAMSVLNPNRSVANLLRHRAPWYRDWRQTRQAHFASPFTLPAGDHAGK